MATLANGFDSVVGAHSTFHPGGESYHGVGVGVTTSWHAGHSANMFCSPGVLSYSMSTCRGLISVLHRGQEPSAWVSFVAMGWIPRGWRELK